MAREAFSFDVTQSRVGSRIVGDRTAKSQPVKGIMHFTGNFSCYFTGALKNRDVLTKKINMALVMDKISM
jgi:hypothetical protein